MASFEELWNALTRSLKRPRKIRNWTEHGGYLGKGNFEASYIGGNTIRVILVSGNALSIHKSEFEYMYENWGEYSSGRLPRGQLRNGSRFTKYTISILKQLARVML